MPLPSDRVKAQLNVHVLAAQHDGVCSMLYGAVPLYMEQAQLLHSKHSSTLHKRRHARRHIP